MRFAASRTSAFGYIAYQVGVIRSRTIRCSNKFSRAAGDGPDGSHASTLYRLPRGSLRSAEGTGERRFEDGSLMLDHYTRKAAQDHLDAAQKVDTTARAVDVAHPNGDALDGTRILPELFAESSPDVCPVLFIKSDPVDSDICGG